MEKGVILLILLLSGVICVLPRIGAQNIILDVTGSKVKAYYSVLLHQNLTSFKPLNIEFKGKDLEAIEKEIEDAVASRASSATVENVLAKLNVEEHSMELSLRFEVGGVFRVEGDKILVDCSWKSFEIPEDLSIGNLSFNRVGETYLRPSIEPLANSSIAFFLIRGTRSIEPKEAMNALGNFTMLDFQAYARGIEDWDKNISMTDLSTRWRYTPEELLDVKIQLRGENYTGTLHTWMNSSASVIAHGLSNAVKDTLVLQRSMGAWTITMGTVILGTFVITLFFFMVGRRYRVRSER